MNINFTAPNGVTWEKLVIGKTYNLKGSTFHDGDTTHAHDSTTFRLAYVDTPEVKSSHMLKSQPFGEKTRDVLNREFAGKMATVKITGVSFNRMVAKVVVNNVDIGLFLTVNGYAWIVVVPDTQKEKELYSKALALAQKEKLNIWGSKTPAIRPSKWRLKYRI